MKHKLIGLCGRRRSGKDTAGKYLVTQGYIEQKFAGALKAMLHAYFNYLGVRYPDIERMIEGDLKEENTTFLQNRSPRFAMQTLGTEWGRDTIGQNLWIDATLQRADMLTPASVITDVRFVNEAQAIKDHGGILVRLNRETGLRDLHVSEKEIEMLDVDWDLDNNDSITELHRKLQAIIKI